MKPLFAAEWWLRGHATVTDYVGVTSVRKHHELHAAAVR